MLLHSHASWPPTADTLSSLLVPANAGTSMLLLPGQHHHTLMPPCQPLPPAGDCTRGARAVHERTGAVKSSFLPRLQVTVLPLLCMIAAVRAAPAVHDRSWWRQAHPCCYCLDSTTTLSCLLASHCHLRATALVVPVQCTSAQVQ
mmetsp:Transcript_12528/g.34206  ORF Transcript_12528/g.34206 Transcript_12528/m.34206 type:complete len:145 (+) Transcript_12528:1586-2020(+)